MLVPSLNTDDMPPIDILQWHLRRGVEKLISFSWWRISTGYWLKESVYTLFNMMHLSISSWFSLWSSGKALWEMMKMTFSLWMQTCCRKRAWWVGLKWKAGGVELLIACPCKWLGCTLRTIHETHSHNGLDTSPSQCLRSYYSTTFSPSVAHSKARSQFLGNDVWRKPNVKSPSLCASCNILTKRKFSLYSLFLEWQRCEGGEPKVR